MGAGEGGKPEHEVFDEIQNRNSLPFQDINRRVVIWESERHVYSKECTETLGLDMNLSNVSKLVLWYFSIFILCWKTQMK